MVPTSKIRVGTPVRWSALACAAVASAVLALGGGAAAAAGAPGLVAAYGLEEGAGLVAADGSGNGRAGTLAGGASWTAGRFGNGLTLDGVSGRVDLPALGTFYDAGFTLEAWVKPRTSGGDQAVLGTWVSADGGGPMIWIDHVVGRYRLTFNKGAVADYLDSGRSPTPGQWQHLAATYDGTTARFYVDGVEVAARTFGGNAGDSNTWRIGAYGAPAGFFDGAVDEIRVYDRALTAAEVQTDMTTPIGVQDSSPPSTPTGFARTGGGADQISVGWQASTDDTGVLGYRLFRNGTLADTTTGTTYTFGGLTCGMTYQLAVEAYDAAGNTSPRATLSAQTDACAPGPPAGLVAAYAFDEGTGGAANDASGNDRTGTIFGATWTGGKFGSALSYSGSGARVDLPALGTFYDTGFTYEAWVKPRIAKMDVGVVGSWVGEEDGGPMIWVDHVSGRYYLTLNTGFGSYLDSGRAPVPGEWHHVAASFDGLTARFYVDGVETANRSFFGDVGNSNTWRVAAYGPAPAGYFDGLIDEVRIYNRALAPAEIEADRDRPVGSPDLAPPSAPSQFVRTSSTQGSISTSWNESTDDVGVTGYRLYRGGTAVGTTSATNYVFTGLKCGTTYGLGVEAFDAAGNASPRTALSTTTSACDPTPPVAPLAAYTFDEGQGTTATDASGHGRTGTIVGGSWTQNGRMGGALSLNGVGDRVDLPALGTFYKTGFTYEAWVKKASSKSDAALMGSWVSTQNGGPMIWADHLAGRYRLTLGKAALDDYLDSGHPPAVGQWEHIAATYDGAVARFYVDGTQVASRPFTGNMGDSNTWRIGAYGSTPGGFFDGIVDEVRIYDVPLSAAQIQAEMTNPATRDTAPPQVSTTTPVQGATNVGLDGKVQATFNEDIDPATVTTSTFRVTRPSGSSVPATVAYDAATKTATLTLSEALAFGTTYTGRLSGGTSGARIRDLAGNPLASSKTWTFSTEAVAPPILVVQAPANPYTTYVGEILRAEGLPFSTVSLPLVTSTVLNSFDVVLLGETALTQTQATLLTSWVQGGGNLVTFRPDDRLTGLLGLSDVGGTVTNGYIRVDTSRAPGTGIVGQTIQFHGSADRYLAISARTVATLYTNASTSTSYAAVTVRDVGTNGGQAAAFTYDLARSIVQTRQGNPAWVGQERDGVFPIRPDDLFFGAGSTDWVNTSRIAIPQADEQQRLLVNLIQNAAADRHPIPRFWYLPWGEKAAVVMTGDDHAIGGTAGRFDQYKTLSPAGCSVVDWECIRGTSYIYPNSPLTNAEAQGFVADGFEVALHLNVAGGSCGNWTPAQLEDYYTTQLSQFGAKYTGVPAPMTERTHCVAWSDWASQPKVARGHGIRLDTNYYHYPGSWIGTTPGFMTGSGIPMRFADADGSLIDVYQASTQMTDESGQAYPTTVDTLLDRALGPEGYYGVFTANMHTDQVSSPGSDAIVASAKARSVPVVSAAQMLTWLDGRAASAFRSIGWSTRTLTFTVQAGSGARGLQAMLPTQGPTGTLSALTRAGSPVVYTTQTVKGVQYALFSATDGQYTAVYG
jgi:hypothetical protein